MMRGIVTPVCILFVCVAFVCFVVPANVFTMRAGLNGQYWLGMDEKMRFWYAAGYLEGIQRGYTQGCINADALFGPDEPTKYEEVPVRKCLDLMPHYPRDTNFYVNQVTSYYKKYPADRHVLLREVIELLTSPPERTLEEIHGMLQGSNHLSRQGEQ